MHRTPKLTRIWNPSLFANASVSGDPDGEEMHLIVTRPVLSDNAKEDQDEGEEGAIVKFDENLLNAVEFIFHVHHIYEVPHPFRTINAEHKDCFRTFIRTQNFNYILELLVVTPTESKAKNGGDIMQLFDGIAHCHRMFHRNEQISLVDGRHLFAVVKELRELNDLYPWKPIYLCGHV